MSEGDAFAGIRLSEQVGPASIEQRLFSGPQPSPTPSVPPKERQEPKPETQETRNPGNREFGKEGKQEASGEGTTEGSREASKGRKARFDLWEVPTRKDSFLYTEQEFEALEDLKIEFRRKYYNKITKNDLARCALHLLVEDYETNQERSFLRRKFHGKPVRR